MRAPLIAALACVGVGCRVDVPTFTPGVTCPADGGPYSGGEGTLEAPYQLCSADDLLALAARPDDRGAAFVLVNDIDLAGVAFPGIGTLDAPFAGHFDGGDHVLHNLSVTGLEHVGLFNAAIGARIANVHLDTVTADGMMNVGAVLGYCEHTRLRNTTIETGTTTGTHRVGGIVGRTDACEVLGGRVNVRVSGTGESVGGIVGMGLRSVFFDIDGTVEVDAPLAFGVGGVVGADATAAVILQNVHITGSVVGNEDVGGIVGMNGDGSQIHRSSFEGTVRGNAGVGGFTGANYDSPFHVYSTSVVADVTGNKEVGGFAGRQWYRTRYIDSYFKGSLTGIGPAQNAFGGFFGSVEYDGWIDRSYTDVTITTEGRAIGGFIGHLGYWSSTSVIYDIARSFSIANLTGRTYESSISPWVGANPGADPLVGNGSYYWSGATCTNNGNGICGTGGASLDDLTAFQTPGSAALAAWDFTNVWQATPGEMPTLRLEQTAAPMPTVTCPTFALAGLRYECDPTLDDADHNEVRVALLEQQHTCSWLHAEVRAAPEWYAPYLAGTPQLDDVGTCTLDYSVTDGPHTVSPTPTMVDVHLGVVMTPASAGEARYSFGQTPIAGSAKLVTFTLTNRETTSTMIGISGLPADGFQFVGGSYPGTGGTCNTTLPASGTCTVVIEFSPPALGAVSHDITLQFDATRGPVSYPFTLTGTGT